MKRPLITKDQAAKRKKKEKTAAGIKADYEMLIKIYGSTKMGVKQFLAKKYKISYSTVERILAK